ncbi:alkene reductase [Acidisoma sp. 7E03]
MSDLFTPFDLCGLALPNRIFMAPLTRSRGPQDAATDLVALYYTQRATAGLIISEGSPISQEGQGYFYNPGIFTPEQIAGWRLVTNSVHAVGGRMFIQLWHVGRISHSSNQPNKGAPVSSTDKAANAMAFGRDDTGKVGFVPASKPRALETDEVARVVGDFVQSARNAMEAGFDGVELHAANGYLFDQFLNPHINDRTDRYSAATIDGRMRFTLEVIDAVSTAIGAHKVGIRLTPYGVIGDVPMFDDAEETYVALGKALGARGITYFHVMDQTGFFNTPAGQKPTSDLIKELLIEWRGVAPNTAILLDGGMTKARATELIKTGVIDLAGFGQPYIANPDLVARLRNDWPLNPPERDTYYQGGAKGYVDYPPYRADKPALAAA